MQEDKNTKKNESKKNETKKDIKKRQKEISWWDFKSKNPIKLTEKILNNFIESLYKQSLDK